MGHKVIVSIRLDSAWDIKRDDLFGENLIHAIEARNPHMFANPSGVHGTQIGPQFNQYVNSTFFVSIEDGNMLPLTIDEQKCLRGSLLRFRKKQQ